MVRRRRSIIVTATLVIASLSAPSAFAAPDPVAGDVNLDGHVDAVDVQLVINAALSVPVASDTDVDFDAAHATNAIDVQLVINAALGIVIDRDRDGLADIAEANLGVNPDVKDTDGGGVDDGVEVLVDHTNPLNPADDQGFVAPTADFTAVPTSGAFPLDVQFTDTSTPGTSPITSWAWVFGDGGASTAQDPLHTYTEQGTYNVQLTVHTSGGQDTITKYSYINVTQPAQPQVLWISPQDGFWDDPANWSTGQVPKASELAIVDLPSQNITVTVRKPTTLYNAQIKEALTITSAGTLVESGQATVDSTFTITGGGTLQVDGAGATFTANGSVLLQNHRINVRNGGLASFPTLTTFTYDASDNHTLFDISGTGSHLDLSHLTSFNFDDGFSSTIAATISVSSSGHLDLSALTTVTVGTNHHFEFDVNTGGTISADLLQSSSGLVVTTTSGSSLNLPGITSVSNVGVSGTGDLTLPNATAAEQLSISISGGSFGAGLLTSIANGSITLNGTAAATLPSLSTLTDTSIALENSASLALPALTSMSSVTGNTLYLSGISASFTADSLTSLTNVVLQVRSGAHLTLPATAFTWSYNVNPPTTLDASGSGSQITLPNLTGLTFDGGSSADITMYVSAGDNGALNLPELVNVTLGTNHKYELDAGSGGSISADKLVTNNGLKLWTGSDSTLTLPGLTNLSSVSISGTGHLVLPSVTAGDGLSVSINGGSVSADGLASISNGSLTVYGTATMTLPVLASLTGTSIDVENSASLSLPSLTSITATTGKTLYLSNSAAFTAASLSSVTNLVLQVRSGAVLTLPISSYNWTINSDAVPFDSSGSGSQLRLPSLTHVTFDAGVASDITLLVSATNGAHIDAAALNSVTLGTNHHVNITADGAGSHIAITALTPLPANVTSAGTNGGTIL
ncbi:MAG: PKD domain-containing protein [Candidatus Hydrogenedentes bacterium]|nr:PKD domain-containing protein [Candidatus Hydrogenedentota bacterium]